MLPQDRQKALLIHRASQRCPLTNTWGPVDATPNAAEEILANALRSRTDQRRATGVAIAVLVPNRGSSLNARNLSVSSEYGPVGHQRVQKLDRATKRERALVKPLVGVRYS